MARVAVALLWLVIAGSAHAAFMKGALTFDDGRSATLTLRRFVKGSGSEIINTVSRFQCGGDACFGGSGIFGFSRPFNGAYDLAFFPSSGSSSYYCDTQALLGRPGVCRLASRVICHVEDIRLNPIIQVVATGMLDVRRTTASCRRRLRQSAR
jgi:hypothetical protein